MGGHHSQKLLALEVNPLPPGDQPPADSKINSSSLRGQNEFLLIL